MAAAPIAEKAIGLRIGVFAEAFDFSHPGLGQPRGDIAFDIKLPMAGFAAGKETLIFVRFLNEASVKAVIDFIAFLRDAWTNGADDTRAIGPQSLHRIKRIVGDAGDRAFPSGMRGPNHSSLQIGKQHRNAICGQDAEQDARPVGHHRIGVRTRIDWQNLVHGDNIR